MFVSMLVILNGMSLIVFSSTVHELNTEMVRDINIVTSEHWLDVICDIYELSSNEAASTFIGSLNSCIMTTGFYIAAEPDNLTNSSCC